MAAEFANDKQEFIPIGEPIEVRFGNRKATLDVLIAGIEVPGAIAMEAMDVVIHLRTQKLSVNPEHPNTPVFGI